jgi:hypothetical protein
VPFQEPPQREDSPAKIAEEHATERKAEESLSGPTEKSQLQAMKQALLLKRQGGAAANSTATKVEDNPSAPRVATKPALSLFGNTFSSSQAGAVAKGTFSLNPSATSFLPGIANGADSFQRSTTQLGPFGTGFGGFASVMSQLPSNPQFGTLSGNYLGGVLGKPATSAGSFGEKLNQADADSSNTTSAAQAMVRREKYHYSNFTENNSDPSFHTHRKNKNFNCVPHVSPTPLHLIRLRLQTRLTTLSMTKATPQNKKMARRMAKRGRMKKGKVEFSLLPNEHRDRVDFVLRSNQWNRVEKSRVKISSQRSKQSE